MSLSKLIKEIFEHFCRITILLLTCSTLCLSVSSNSLAGDSTTIDHPTNFNWHVVHASDATKAYSVDNTGIPNCGPGNALTDTGNGFSCMTPAKGDTGATGSPGSQGAQGVQGPAGSTGATGSPGSQGAQGPQGVQGPAGSSASCRVGNVCWQDYDTLWHCSPVCIP